MASFAALVPGHGWLLHLAPSKKNESGADKMYPDVTMCQAIGDNLRSFSVMVRKIWEKPSLYTELYDPALKLCKSSLYQALALHVIRQRFLAKINLCQCTHFTLQLSILMYF